MATILIVDDDEGICTVFRRFLVTEGHVPHIVSSALDALRCVAELHPDLVIMDVCMPGLDGLEALESMRKIDPDLYVVMMTAYGTSQMSIEAVQLGAYDYLPKPLDLGAVKAVIDKALETRQLSLETPAESAEEWQKYALVNLIGDSAPMQEVYKLIGRLTTNDLPVLLVGERGTGKQLVAKTMHFNSRRKERPFVAIDCWAMPDDLLGAELFGRETGEAAAGGRERISGKFETAQGGTVFLDNIHAMSLPLQARLTRVLEEGTYERPGGGRSVKVDARVLAATDSALTDAVRSGRFHAELYQHLRVLPLILPPLRERREDIPGLVTHFLQRYSREFDKTIKGMDSRVMQRFMEYAWPGNVGELQRVVERACVLARGDVITVHDLGESLQDHMLPDPERADTALSASVRATLHQRLRAEPPSPTPFYDIIGQVEKSLVREALVATNGNQVKAAELLGLNRTTLRTKIRIYDL